MQVSRGGVVSPSSQLVVKLLHEFIAAPYAHALLALTPAPLMPNLVPLLAGAPEAFSYAQLLAITAPKANQAKVSVRGAWLTLTLSGLFCFI